MKGLSTWGNATLSGGPSFKTASAYDKHFSSKAAIARTSRIVQLQEKWDQKFFSLEQ